ncbi:MAG: FAD-dependent oxidoreductase [Thermoleophilia bacterium]|nr:FAD-dependent oxidoreductase [Thermoleophilia bacterium]
MTAHTSTYLIVGGGLTADSACRAIRERDPDGSIVVVGEEPHPPYLRPPLSKALWRGKPESTIWRGTEQLGVELRLGRRAAAVDLEARTVRDEAGERYRYERLLLATGGRPRQLVFGENEAISFRTLDDYRRLRALAGANARVCVIGGGFIGSELAAALALNDCRVTMAFPEVGIGARLFPAELSAALNDYYRDRGVRVLAGALVGGIERRGESLEVSLEDGRTIGADAVVAGIGIEPNVELASAAGLPVADGIVVDGYGRAGGRDDVFAAGDVARFPAAGLGPEVRVEHEDHARSHGYRVGANMTGERQRYDHLPFFYSDLFDAGYEAVGELDARLETLVDWSGPEGEGTVIYRDRERRPRGVLLWNRFGHVDAARELIRAGQPVEDGVRVG